MYLYVGMYMDLCIWSGNENFQKYQGQVFLKFFYFLGDGILELASLEMKFYSNFIKYILNTCWAL